MPDPSLLARIALFMSLSALPLRGEADYTRFANCWTFIGQVRVEWHLPGLFHQPKNGL
jgi:hypothetical protein